jgi:RimJ/RimL family protein N-acetyltransferase
MLEWNGIVVLTTPRLLLRTFRREDLAPYAVLNADLEVVRYLGGVPMTHAASDQMADWAQERHAKEGIGLLAVERRADGAFLGMCGLHHLDWYPDDIEIGWRFAREHWGQGYATEAASAWLEHAFGALQLPRVISVCDVPNLRSRAVMHRVGMLFDHATELEEDGVVFAAVVHTVTAEQWRTRLERPGCTCLAG